MKPQQLEVHLSHNGYIANFEVYQPHSLVEHDRYVVKTHELQMKKQNSTYWSPLKAGLAVTPGENHSYRVPIPPKMLGCETKFRVQARTDDDLEFPSETLEVLQPTEHGVYL